MFYRFSFYFHGIFFRINVKQRILPANVETFLIPRDINLAKPFGNSNSRKTSPGSESTERLNKARTRRWVSGLA